MEAYGYTLLQLIGNDAMFIRKEDKDLFGGTVRTAKLSGRGCETCAGLCGFGGQKRV